MFFAWQAVSSSGADASAQQRTMLAAARLAGKPLEGIDEKLSASTEQADTFYARRLPYAYSQVVAELGVVSKRSGVRLARVAYLPVPGLVGRYALTQLSMDASISGDYRPVIGFINALERDRTFFVIMGATLTGQQTGQVNLRLRILTYLRAPGVEESAAELPTDSSAPAPNTAAAGGTQ